MKHLIVLLVIATTILQACKTAKFQKADKQAIALLDTVTVSGKPKEYRAAATRKFDLLHTKLDVSFNWEKQYLYGKANLVLKPYFYETNTLILDAKGFNIKTVALVVNDSTKSPLIFEYKDSLQLHISLPKTYTQKDTFEIFIDYTAKPNELKQGGSNAITSDKGLYFINPKNEEPNKPQQIWTQGETEASSCWFPTIDKPNERTTAEICITVADTMITLSNGLLTESSVLSDGTKTECWTMEQAHAPYLFMMAIGQFAVVKDTWRNKEVSYYVEPKYEPYAKNIFGNTPEMLEFFSNKLGVAYPWPKYAQVAVRDYVSGAMENTSASIFLEQIQSNNRERLDRNWDFIIAHELFHQWFGDFVTCESWSNLTLNEAFATYAEYLWNEYKYGKDEADYYAMQDLKRYLGEARQYQEPLIRYFYEDKEDMFDAHTYEKGGLILHMLRNYLGDEAFFKGLQLYLTQNAYKSVEAANLRLAFEEVSGEDLNWFFNQWFLSSGHPKLTFTYEYNDSTKKQVVIIKQERSNENISRFQLPMRIDLYFENGTIKTENITMTGKEKRFEFDAATRPKLVNVDAKKILLCEKDDKKPDEQFIHQYYFAPLVADKLEALVALSNKQESDTKVKMLFQDALLAKHWSVRENAINKLFLDDSLSRAQNFNALKKAALSDEKSSVRYAALKKLNNYTKEQQVPIYKVLMGDSSYMVAAKSLKCLYEIDTTAALQNASLFEKENNAEYIDVIAGIYANSGTALNNSYFTTKFKNADNNAVGYLLKHYKTFLLKFPKLIDDSSLSNIEQVALKNDSWWIRSEAGAVMHNIYNEYKDKTDAESIAIKEKTKNLFINIKDKEKNTKAIERYKKLEL